jgi:hypothetical protein
MFTELSIQFSRPPSYILGTICRGVKNYVDIYSGALVLSFPTYLNTVDMLLRPSRRKPQNMPFVKLDTGILNSTLWVGFDARNVFITALLMAEPREITEPTPQLKVQAIEPTGFVVPPGWYGFVKAAGIGIVRQSGIDRDRGMAALEELGDPDTESRSAEYEGRRLVRVNGGFVVLNYMKYRERDETNAQRCRRYRERQKKLLETHSVDRSDTPCRQVFDMHAEAEAEAEAEVKSSTGFKSIAKGRVLGASVETSKGTPSGLNELQYAGRLMEEIKMPHTPQNLRHVAAGIAAEASQRGGLAQAYDFLLEQARAEIERKGTVSGFWFQDAKWREKKKTEKGSGILNVNGADIKRRAAEKLKK